MSNSPKEILSPRSKNIQILGEYFLGSPIIANNLQNNQRKNQVKIIKSNKDFRISSSQGRKVMRIINEQNNSSLLSQEPLTQRSHETREKSNSNYERKRYLKPKNVQFSKLSAQLTKCNSCTEWILGEQTIVVQQCFHTFHFKCVEDKLEYILNCQLTCPVLSCTKKLKLSQLRKIQNTKTKYLLEEFHIKQIKEYLVKMFNQVSLCPELNCNYFFFFNQNINQIHFCPECRIIFCFSCNQVITKQKDHQCQKKNPDLIFHKKLCECGELIEIKIQMIQHKQIKCTSCEKSLNLYL